jgi:uncharacterized protein (TIGR00290 family)
MLKVAASWSGGKDSCFACYKALADGFRVSHLLNMVNRDAKRGMSHGLPCELIAMQARAIGLPIVQRETTWDTYEREFKEAVTGLKQMGIGGMVFGDIDLEEHRDWVERVCGEVGVKAFLPLWGVEQEQIIADFVARGFEAIVVSAKADLLGSGWLGRSIDGRFISDLKAVGVTMCGEEGEFHTFVTNGPLFKRRVKILKGDGVLRDGYWFLDISE